MRTLLSLLVLLGAHSSQVQPLPYHADEDGNCQPRDFLLEDSTLCCRMCPPGQRLREKCSATQDTQCEPCAPRLFRKTWNYADTCQACTKCNTRKGLMVAQSCNATANSLCECKPGMFCIMYSRGSSSCSDCQRHKVCRAGFGVSEPGTATADVQCKTCPNGTFSDTSSSTDTCRPHTSCPGGRVIKEGTPTSDAECESDPLTPRETMTRAVQPQHTTDSPVTDTTSTTVAFVPKPPASRSTWPPQSHTEFPTHEPDSNAELVAIVTGAIVGILAFLIIVFVFLICCKQKKDAAKYKPKVDANGNCKNADDACVGFLGETQLTTLTVTAAEQQCLLQRGGGSSSEHSQSSSSDSFSPTEGHSSGESIGPLHSTAAFGRPHSPPSEPTSLHSVAEPPAAVAAPQPGPPTSPPVLSPVTTSPHVNVNITFNIGNGTCSAVAAPAPTPTPAPAPAPTPTPTPADPPHADPHLPFGEEEECVIAPQQEAGNHSQVSVEKSDNHSV